MLTRFRRRRPILNLRLIPQMTPEEITQTVTTLVCNHFSAPTTLDLDTPFSTLGDSIDRVEINLQFEEAFGLTICPTMVAQLKTPNDLITYARASRT